MHQTKKVKQRKAKIKLKKKGKMKKKTRKLMRRGGGGINHKKLTGDSGFFGCPGVNTN
jgi:hypothetical protein